MLKPLLCAAGGAAVGFYIAKLRYEKAAYAYAIERVEEAKAYAEERADRKIQEFQAEASVLTVDAVADVMREDNRLVEEVLGDSEKFVDLLQAYSGFESAAPPLVEEEDSESHIVLLKRQEFFEGPLNDHYQQTSVSYYQNDDVLYDDMGQKQLDVKAAVGSIRPSWFGDDALDENVCYVRNTKIQVEFEVVRSQGSFAKDVLGLGENEAE
jgi:hypothetical protein